MEKLTKLTTNIYFWIILFFAIRLIGITNPPLEIAHNWRQTTVTMVARNFLEVNANIFYPRIDFAGEKTGITGMEFPLLNYLVFLVAKIFGFSHWYGRLINLLISSIGLVYFFKLIKKYFNYKIAFNATLLLLFSLWFSFSRKIMPDTFAMSFIITAIYYGSNYLDINNNKKLISLAVYFVLVTFGVLSKLPSGYLLSVFLILIVNKSIPLTRKIWFSITSLVAIAIVSAWYFYWVPHLVNTYGFWHFYMGTDLIDGATEILNNLPLTLKRFYATAMQYSGFTVFLGGLILAIVKKQKLILAILFLAFGSFLIVILKAGFAFPHHSYYVLPFIPIMALVAGYGISIIKNKKLAYILLAIICIEGFANQIHDINIHDKNKALLNLEGHLNNFANKNDLIAINSDECPTPMYFANYRGWLVYNNQLTSEHISELKSKGLKHIIILKRAFGTEIKLNLPISFNNEDYCIYRL